MMDTNLLLIILVAANLVLLVHYLRHRQAVGAKAIRDSHSEIIEAKQIANDLCEGYFEADLTIARYEVSESWIQSTGYTNADLPAELFDMFAKVVHPDDFTEVTTLINEAAEGKAPAKIRAVFRLLHADGHWIWIDGRARFFFDNNGNPQRMVGSFIDISRVKKNEQALQHAQILAGLREYRFDASNHTVALGPIPVPGEQPQRPEEWVYQPTSEVTHPDDLPSVLRAIEQAGIDQTPLKIEFRLITPGGEVRNIILYGDTELHVDGTYLAHHGVIRDITEQKQAESRYIEFGKLLEGSRTGLIITRISDLQVLFVNDKYCADSGFSKAQALDLTTDDLISDWTTEQIHGLFDVLQQKRDDAEKWFYESATMRHKNGSTYPVDAWAQLTEWEGETVIATMISDISDRQQGQQMLRNSEQKYRQMFDALPDGVLLFRSDEATILECNQEILNQHGWSHDELIGQHIEVLTSAEDLHLQQETIQKAIGSSQVAVVEAMNLRKDKSEFPIEAYVKSVNISGNPAIITVLRDVTERHRYIQTLKQQKAEIEQFTYSISHDLKSPLITIEGFSEILAENLANNDLKAAHDDLNRINRAAAKMHQLLTELLEYSRLGVAPHQSQLTSINAVIDDALDQVAGQITESSARVRVQPDQPNVNGDHDRLSQLYQNLIDNAIKFRRDDEPVEIELGWETESHHFYVDDNGLGISLQFQEQIFTLFEQLDPGLNGSGIGLATGKRIIENHGGSIWVQSPSPLGGTRICFTLPALP